MFSGRRNDVALLGNMLGVDREFLLSESELSNVDFFKGCIFNGKNGAIAILNDSAMLRVRGGTR